MHEDRFFSKFFGFPTPISFHRGSPYSYIIWGMNNRSGSGNSSETQYYPINMNNNNNNVMILLSKFLYSLSSSFLLLISFSYPFASPSLYGLLCLYLFAIFSSLPFFTFSVTVSSRLFFLSYFICRLISCLLMILNISITWQSSLVKTECE
jgi:hypothetical protein